MPRKDDHLEAIEAVLRGENTSGFSDRKTILAHARAMDRTIRQLEEQLRLQHAQLGLIFESQESMACCGTH